MRFNLPVVLLVVCAVVTMGPKLGPPDTGGWTGAPALGGFRAEMTCNEAPCHGEFRLNLNGQLEILGVPDAYTPGTTYTLTVRLTSAMNQLYPARRWGFECVVLRLDTGVSTGTVHPGDLKLAEKPTYPGRTYISHDGLTNLQGMGSPVSWEFAWEAPPESVGPIAFYAAGNAGDGDGTKAGDAIYTASATTVAAATPVVRRTWGQIKRSASRNR